MKLSKIKPIWQSGIDMLKFESEQGDHCYCDLHGNIVSPQINKQYLVTLDETEKNSIVLKIR